MACATHRSQLKAHYGQAYPHVGKSQRTSESYPGTMHIMHLKLYSHVAWARSATNFGSVDGTDDDHYFGAATVGAHDEAGVVSRHFVQRHGAGGKGVERHWCCVEGEALFSCVDMGGGAGKEGMSGAANRVWVGVACSVEIVKVLVSKIVEQQAQRCDLIEVKM